MREPDPSSYVWKTSRDHATRMHDWLTLHYRVLPLEQQMSGAWVAIKLADGDSDGVVYDTRSDAYSHQFHPLVCLYHRIVPPAPPSVTACDVLLWYTRRAYDNGYRPDQDHDLALPTPLELNRVSRSRLN